MLNSLDRVVTAYLDERAAADPDTSLQSPPWPERVLPLWFWGCSNYAALDCADPDGPVLLFEEDRAVQCPDGNWAIDQAWTIDAVTLAAWWERWLTGERSAARGAAWSGWRGRL